MHMTVNDFFGSVCRLKNFYSFAHTISGTSGKRSKSIAQVMKLVDMQG